MIEAILNHLKVPQSPPTLAYLQELITAYCSRVPWESVSRIARKATFPREEDCVLSAPAFWEGALRLGTGGTCYESNWAFFYLLEGLGFKGYPTINTIQDKSSLHSALIIEIGGRKYLVDIGYPTYAPILVDEDAVTTTGSAQAAYRCTPLSTNEYRIEIFPHPAPYLYHLSDIPVSAKDYREIMRKDYGKGGLFLDRIVMRKLVHDVPTRFDSADLPYNIHTLMGGKKEKTYLEGEKLEAQLSHHFGLDADLIRQAFLALEKRQD
jgi:arylamine N-acetyltransferase